MLALLHGLLLAFVQGVELLAHFQFAAMQARQLFDCALLLAVVLQHAAEQVDLLGQRLGLGASFAEQQLEAVALRLQANGYDVVGWSRRPAAVGGLRTVHGDDGHVALLTQAEIVINLLPLTASTRDFFSAATFAGMRPGASLVNLARGAHVVDEALLEALDSGHLHRAVLDVFRTEPLPAGHRFWAHPRVTVLPHAAAQTDARTAAGVVAANVHALREGRALRHLVDRGAGY